MRSDSAEEGGEMTVPVPSGAGAYSRPRPDAEGECRRCAKNWSRYLDVQLIVSPGGVEHFGLLDGSTLCGMDATGPEWWWPL